MFSWINVGIVLGVVTAVTGGLFLMQRWIPHHRREKHNEVAGYIFAAIGVLYAVLMAFVIVALWGDDDAAQQTTVGPTTWPRSTGCRARCRWPRGVRSNASRWTTPRRRKPRNGR